MKKTWKATRPLIDYGPHLGVVLSNGCVALVDHQDRSVVEGWNWTAGPSSNGTYALRRDTLRGRISIHGEIAGPGSDHKDGNTLDCRRANLRPATHAQNTHNRKIGSSNTSGYKGVFFRPERNRWLAVIVKDGRRKKMTAKTAFEAAKLYDIEAKKLFGEFAKLNFPGGDPEAEALI